MTVLQSSVHLVPAWAYLTEFCLADKQLKENQKKNFYQTHRVCEQDKFSEGTEVCVNCGAQPERGHVVVPDPLARSYLIATPTGEVRYNCSQIVPIPESKRLELTDSPTKPGNNTVPDCHTFANRNCYCTP